MQKLIILVLVLAGMANAADPESVWTGAAGSDFYNTANWTGGGEGGTFPFGGMAMIGGCAGSGPVVTGTSGSEVYNTPQKLGA